MTHRATNEDDLGLYEVPVTNKPVDENDTDSIYLALFDNGKEIKDSCRFKVQISFVDEHGHINDFTAPILNHFEPARWLRSIDEKNREQPFYRQCLQAKATLAADPVPMEKKFSAGFFYSKENGHKSPYECAYAYMIWVKEQQPIIGVRFFDYSIDPVALKLNEYKKGRGPKWHTVIKSPKQGMIDCGW